MSLHRSRSAEVGFMLLLAVLVTSGPAHAAGSLGLGEVLEAVKSAPKLVAEIEDALRKNNLKADDVICAGARHGNHWRYLGAGRAAPYACEIGKSELVIEADRTYFDARGRALGNVEKANPKRAHHFRETNFRWTWKPEQ